VKLALVVGPEGSGSALVSRIIAHVVGATDYKRWNGLGHVRGNGWKVLHRSLPSLRRAVFYDIEEMIRKHAKHELYLVLTTRDMTFAQRSAMSRFGRTKKEAQTYTARAARIMGKLMDEYDCLVWSYETLVFLKAPYLKRLYRFLGIESDFVPPLYNANSKKRRRRR